MKCRQLIVLIVLGILTGMPSTVFAKSTTDSLVLNRIFSYRRNYTPNDVYGFTTNVYIKNNFNVWKRNFTLWLVPSMYSIADGDRYLVTESYNKLRFNDVNNYDIKRQVCFSTIRHNRSAMPTIVEFLTPNLYDICLYGDHVLSPFNSHNRHYYVYHVAPQKGDTTIVNFKPRLLKNTQLIKGTAKVSTATGRIYSTRIEGDYDMITFRTDMDLGEEGARSLLPKKCRTDLKFIFFGNKIYSTYDAVFDCPANLPDSLDEVFDLALMDSLRPIPLTIQEEHIYNQYKESHQPDTTEVADTVTVRNFNFVKDVLQDAIGDNLISSLRYRSENTYMKLSPLLNPQYIGYSRTHGLSYKIKFGSQYNFSPHRYLEFDPWLGYNFKYKKLYFTLPLDFTYNPKRNGQVHIIYGNGNRISNSNIIEDIRHEHEDTLNLTDKQLDYFDDNYLTISNNVMVYDWLEVSTGLTYHHRVPYKPDEIWNYGKPQTYNSLAPMLSFKFKPWRRGPVLSVDYERGIKGILRSDIDYERWEFDGSIKYAMKPLRKINVKIGGGFYSRKKDSYFVDYMHFRDNKLPDGWDDDWTGDFQLLDSRWYNESRYYVRANFSYESPLLAASWLPLIGQFFEKERFYLSALGIEHTRPYSELGYGFSTRFLSIGVFASFLNTKFQDFECKFTFELFRRW